MYTKNYLLGKAFFLNLFIMLSLLSTAQLNTATTSDQYINGNGNGSFGGTSSTAVVKLGSYFMHVMAFDGLGSAFAWEYNGTTGQMLLGSNPYLSPFLEEDTDPDIIVVNVSGDVVAYIVQSVRAATGSNHNRKVMIRSSRWTGSTFGSLSTAVFVSNSSATDCWNPTIDDDGNGNFIVAYNMSGQTYARSYAYQTSSPYYSAGSSYNISSNFTGWSNNFVATDVAMNPAGTAVFLSTHKTSMNIQYLVYQSTYSNLSSGTVHNMDSTCPATFFYSITSHRPKIAVSSDPNKSNDFAIAYVTHEGHCSYYQYLDLAIYNNGNYIYKNAISHAALGNDKNNYPLLSPSLSYSDDMIEVCFTYYDAYSALNVNRAYDYAMSSKYYDDGTAYYPSYGGGYSISHVASATNKPQATVSNCSPKIFSDQADFYYTFYDTDNDHVVYKKSQNTNTYLRGNSNGVPVTKSMIIHKPDFINCYPNPATDKISLIVNRDIQVKNITVYNALGETMLLINNNILKTDIDISTWQRGVYLIVVTGNSGKHFEKFVKQ